MQWVVTGRAVDLDYTTVIEVLGNHSARAQADQTLVKLGLITTTFLRSSKMAQNHRFILGPYFKVTDSINITVYARRF